MAEGRCANVEGEWLVAGGGGGGCVEGTTV